MISSVESLKKPSTLQLIKATTFPSKSTSFPRDKEAKETSLKEEDQTTTEDQTTEDNTTMTDLQEDSMRIEPQEKKEDQDKTVAQEKKEDQDKTEDQEKTDPNADTTTDQEDKKTTEKDAKTEDLNTTTDLQEETITTETSTEDNHKLKVMTGHQEDNRDMNHAERSSVNADQSNGLKSMRLVQEMIELTSSSRLFQRNLSKGNVPCLDAPWVTIQDL